MHLSSLLPIGFAACVSAQAITDVLANNAATLSTLSCMWSIWHGAGARLTKTDIALLQTVPEVAQVLSTAQNVTVFAPSNDAFTRLMTRNPRSAELMRNPRLLAGVLQYHVLQGAFRAQDFSTVPKFPATLLTTPFANVTGGQRVGLVFVNNTVQVFSGYKQTAQVVTAVRPPVPPLYSTNPLPNKPNNRTSPSTTTASSTSSTKSSPSPPIPPRQPSTQASPPSPAPSPRPAWPTASTA